MEIDQLPFGLGDDLLGHDQDIAAAEGKPPVLGRLDDYRSEIDARRDVCRTLQTDDADFGSHQVRTLGTFFSMWPLRCGAPVREPAPAPSNRDRRAAAA